jgi:hypothetical protein
MILIPGNHGHTESELNLRFGGIQEGKRCSMWKEDGLLFVGPRSIFRGRFFGFDCDAECQLVFQCEFGVLGANQGYRLLTNYFHATTRDESKCQQLGACVSGQILQGDDASSRTWRQITKGETMRASSMPAVPKRSAVSSRSSSTKGLAPSG